MPFRFSQPSFQSLYIEMRANGKTIDRGTAFVANSSSGANFLITSRHNVTGRNQDSGDLLSEETVAFPDSIAVWHNSSAALGEFIKVDVPLLVGGIPQWIEHPVLQANADFVALPISDRQDIEIYPYRAENLANMHIEPAETVSVVGFPFGERTGASFAVWATGFVASEPDINHGGRPVFLIDCRSRKGQSGSPVIRYRSGGGVITYDNGTEVVSPICRLLGIYSGRINNESDLGIVWKAYALAELINHACTLNSAS